MYVFDDKDNFRVNLRRSLQMALIAKVKRFLSPKIIKAKNKYIHIGCGYHKFNNFDNLDFYNSSFSFWKKKNYISHDFRYKLPFEDNSHDVIVLSHGLEYTHNPYLLMREVDRIATDDALILVIGFNKFSLWTLVKAFSSKAPWNINFLSPYIIKEWFKILEYKINYQKTFGVFPYIGKSVSSFFSDISFLHKIIRNQFGGIFIFTYKKSVIPLTPQKLVFSKDYKVVSNLAKNI